MSEEKKKGIIKLLSEIQNHARDMDFEFGQGNGPATQFHKRHIIAKAALIKKHLRQETLDNKIEGIKQ
jgi:hypothetical protein